MAANKEKKVFLELNIFLLILFLVVIAGVAVFLFILSKDPGRAWQAYHINYLLWSSVAQGALAFSVVNHISRAKWSVPLQGLAESFTAFFPLSFILFLLLYLGRENIFPWLHMELKGKWQYLNLPFLFSRDIIGLLILYGSGFAYLYHALWVKLGNSHEKGGNSGFLNRLRSEKNLDPNKYRSRMSVYGIIYLLAFATVLSMLSIDLVMSLDPHWISTLFPAYSFIKAFYLGLGAIIILASMVYYSHGAESGLSSTHFYNIGKLLFAFSLLWGDFFYVQFLVIWYGNISEETHYVIERTFLRPWQGVAIIVFAAAFVLPFFVLLNRKIKSTLYLMVPLCLILFGAFWLEHLLLVGPALNINLTTLGLWEGIISLAFAALMLFSVTCFLRLFPELVVLGRKGLG